MTRLPLQADRFLDAVGRGDASRAGARFEDAISAYREAIDARGEDLAANEAADLLVRIAECNIERGDLDAAEAALDEAASHDTGNLRLAVRGAAHVARGYVALARGRVEETVREGEAAWNALRSTGENALLARALNCRGHGLRRLGRVEAAQQDFLDAMAAARRAGDEHEIGLAASNLGFTLWQRGEYVEARAHHRRAVEIHEACGSETHLTREMFALAVDEFHCGAWTEASALLTRCGERARRAGDRRLEVAVRIQEARLALARGEDPSEGLESAREIAAREGYGHDLVLVGQHAGEAAMERGAWSEAAAILDETWRRATSASPDGEPSGDTAWRLALAEEHLGDPHGRVLDVLRRALERAEANGYRALEALVRRALGVVLAHRGGEAAARAEFDRSVAILRSLRMPYETGRSLLRADDAASLREARAIFAGLGAVREERRAAERLASLESAAGAAAAAGREPAARAPFADPFATIATSSPPMKEAVHRAGRIAPARIPVLLLGETGTGKELFARAIHEASGARKRPFLAVNCAALTETLLEAELFGHVRGAFTGALTDRAGIFEAADGGTVFLDEIGKAPRALQAKLLRVVDTGEVRRVGGVEAVRVEVRIVAATNVDLRELTGRGEFLTDLFYRLRGFEIAIPPLRDRVGDVGLLFERFAGRPASAAALEVLERHDWPGNVRELRHLAESAAFLAGGSGPIVRDALPEWIRESAGGAAAGTRVPGARRLDELERREVVAALVRTAGNRAKAARVLGISRQTLYTKIAKYRIDGTRWDEERGEEGLTHVA